MQVAWLTSKRTMHVTNEEKSKSSKMSGMLSSVKWIYVVKPYFGLDLFDPRSSSEFGIIPNYMDFVLLHRASHADTSMRNNKTHILSKFSPKTDIYKT